MGIKTPPFFYMGTVDQLYQSTLSSYLGSPVQSYPRYLQKPSVRFYTVRKIGIFMRIFPSYRVASVGHCFESLLNGQSHKNLAASLGPSFHLYS
jgi:hypothetical protein